MVNQVICFVPPLRTVLINEIPQSVRLNSSELASYSL